MLFRHCLERWLMTWNPSIYSKCPQVVRTSPDWPHSMRQVNSILLLLCRLLLLSKLVDSLNFLSTQAWHWSTSALHDSPNILLTFFKWFTNFFLPEDYIFFLRNNVLSNTDRIKIDYCDCTTPAFVRCTQHTKQWKISWNAIKNAWYDFILIMCQ